VSERLAAIPPGEQDAEQAALYAEITGGPRATGPQHFALTADDGSLNGPFNGFLLSPGIGRALQELGAAVRYRTDLSGREREIAILIVATHWRSGFERHAHEAVGRAAGLTETELAAIRAGDLPELTDDRERAVATATLALANGDLDDTQWAELAGTLGPSTVFELSTLVGYYATLALQLRIFRVDTQGEK
jgi:4-carboxymuconolactone decarboxylase